MATGNLKARGLPIEVEDWLEILKVLTEDVKAWAEEAGWEIRLTGRDVNEKGGLRYEVPVLILDRNEVELSLVPVVRKLSGADGLVNFYALPDFDDVANLHREKGQWFFQYAFHPNPMETHSVRDTDRILLDRASLRRVLDDIAAHAQAHHRTIRDQRDARRV